MSLGHISCIVWANQAVIWSRANQENGNSQFATVSKVWGLMVRELYLRKRWLIQLSMGAKATKNRERSKELEYATFFFFFFQWFICTWEETRTRGTVKGTLYCNLDCAFKSRHQKKGKKKKGRKMYARDDGREIFAGKNCMLEMMEKKYLGKIFLISILVILIYLVARITSS